MWPLIRQRSSPASSSGTASPASCRRPRLLRLLTLPPPITTRVSALAAGQEERAHTLICSPSAPLSVRAICGCCGRRRGTEGRWPTSPQRTLRCTQTHPTSRVLRLLRSTSATVTRRTKWRKGMGRVGTAMAVPIRATATPHLPAPRTRGKRRSSSDSEEEGTVAAMTAAPRHRRAASRTAVMPLRHSAAQPLRRSHHLRQPRTRPLVTPTAVATAARATVLRTATALPHQLAAAAASVSAAAARRRQRHQRAAPTAAALPSAHRPQAPLRLLTAGVSSMPTHMALQQLRGIINGGAALRRATRAQGPIGKGPTRRRRRFPRR